MSKLAFVIPSNNRAAELEVCVRSIATQIRSNMDAKIIILNDGSTDETGDVCDKLEGFYPFIETRHLAKHDDYSDIFRTMFRAAPESEWVWTFGDDDKLQPGALEFMYAQLEASPQIAFFHVVEELRASGGSGAYKGAFLDLCRNFGWIELTGFITGNITRGPLLAKCAETPRWKEYSKNAFVQSCALLECLKDEQAVFLDIPLIATQHKEQTQETIDRWARNQIAVRYQFLGQALERMYEDGTLTTKMPPKFFRYLSYNIWDRFLTYMTGDYIDRYQMWSEDTWANVARFAQFIDDDAVATKLMQDVEVVRGMITLHFYMKQNQDGIFAEIASVSARRAEALYSYSIAAPPPEPVGPGSVIIADSVAPATSTATD